MGRIIVFLGICVLAVLPARAADFNAGVVAFLEGDYSGALVQWAPLAEEGHGGAQFNLGAMYRDGRGVPQDLAEAAWWFARSAESGHLRAQFALAVMYAEGEVVPKDFVEAAKWYGMAAEQGHAQAQYNLGVLLANGEGGAKDLVNAMKWLQIAGGAGVDAAVVGRELLAADMVPDDITEADRLARLWSAGRPQNAEPGAAR